MITQNNKLHNNLSTTFLKLIKIYKKVVYNEIITLDLNSLKPYLLTAKVIQRLELTNVLSGAKVISYYLYH